MKRNGRQTKLGQEGIALITTLLLVLAAGALLAGAALLSSNHTLVDRYWTRQSNLVNLAEAGLEEGRALLNGDKSHFPDEGYTVLESGVSLQDGDGVTIPGVRRWTYTGPSGITSGQYGVFGALVSVVRDDGGGIAVRRQQVFQESFAKFAYFTDNEGGSIYFGGNDNIWGPLHSNDQLKIHSTRASFWDEVTTAQDVYQPYYGDFAKGYTEWSPVIPMPETADLVKLQTQATAGHTSFSSNFNGGEGEATLRIEFVAVDLNGDGDETDEDEGFFRVYRSTDFNWVSAKFDGANILRQCGDYDLGPTTFKAAIDHTWGDDGHNSTGSLARPTATCYLGGDDRIWNTWRPNDGIGQWIPWTGAVDSRLATLRADADYLFPITRPLNPDFKGVIYVDGKVVISGKIRGRVTVAATGNIIFGDDITYATDPGAGTCDDIAGYFSGQSIVISNNTLNAPWSTGGPFLSFDETNGEFIHGVVLALQNFGAEEYNTGSTAAQPCGATTNGRGCIFLTGGIIQDTRGAVGLTSGQGYIKRYSYDQCAATQPPPYFPTTGVFVQGQSYQVDPAGFDIDDYFALIAPG